MAVRALVVTVTGANPQLLLDATKSDDGISATVQNTGSATAYLGGSDMTNANYATHGFPLIAGAGLDFDGANNDDSLYAFVPSSGTTTLNYIASKV